MRKKEKRRGAAKRQKKKSLYLIEGEERKDLIWLLRMEQEKYR